MKRTCKTCKHAFFSFFDGKLKCYREENHKGMVIPVDDKKPACEHYELALSALDDAFDASLAKARKKHPDFVSIPAGSRAHAIGTAAGNMAKQIKTDLERESTAQHHVDCQLEMALKGELYEFLEAFHHGDFNAALSEAGDVVAVLYRALNGEGRRA